MLGVCSSVDPLGCSAKEDWNDRWLAFCKQGNVFFHVGGPRFFSVFPHFQAFWDFFPQN